MCKEEFIQYSEGSAAWTPCLSHWKVCDKLGMSCARQTEYPAHELSELNEQKQGKRRNLKKSQTGVIHPSLSLVIIDATRCVALKADRVKKHDDDIAWPIDYGATSNDLRCRNSLRHAQVQASQFEELEELLLPLLLPLRLPKKVASWGTIWDAH